MAVTRITGALPRFTYGDVDSDSFQLFVGAAETYNAPAADIQQLTIPGRNGSFLKGSYSPLLKLYGCIG